MRSTVDIFAENLKKRRKELGLTQKDLAYKIEYSEKSVSKWENGGGLPPTQLLPALASVLKTTIDELLCESGVIDYYLGIDGGGTKTEFALADSTGAVVKRIVLEGCNPVDIGIDECQRILASGIESVTEGISLSRISVFAGLAGGITGDNQRKINRFLKKYRFGRYDNGSDAQNAVYAGLKESDGVAVIIGTGAIVFARRDRELIRIGGYGYLFGDMGSGYSIGRDGIAAALSAEDGSGDATILLESVREKCGKPRVLDALSDFYTGGKRLIADYASTVFDAEARGDRVAREILETNFKQLARLIKTAVNKIYDGKRLPVTLVGGISKRESTVLGLLKDYLKEIEDKCTTQVCKLPVVNGALMLAGIEVK